jgi:hypothetical protein
MTPAEWFHLRGDWLTNIEAVQVGNGFEVRIRVDGTYRTREDAERNAAVHRREIEELVAWCRGRGAA